VVRGQGRHRSDHPQREGGHFDGDQSFLLNRQVLMRIPVQISYNSNLETAMKLMLKLPRSHPRVLGSRRQRVC